MGRQLLLLALAFGGGTLIALALGAINLGTAFGVGQICFAAMLVWVLMSNKPCGRGQLHIAQQSSAARRR